jgi:hypothetical protein
VLAAWQERSRSTAAPRPELLIDTAGKLDQARLSELLRARDHRPVHLLE